MAGMIQCGDCGAHSDSEGLPCECQKLRDLLDRAVKMIGDHFDRAVESCGPGCSLVACVYCDGHTCCDDGPDQHDTGCAYVEFMQDYREFNDCV